MLFRSVGMTRAKEKLIMTASMPSAPKKLGDLTVQSTLTELSRPVPPETVDGARSMAEWILLPLLRRQDAAALRAQTGLELTGWAETEDTPWQVAYHDGTLYGEAPALPAAEPACDEENAALPVDREALDYVYPHQAAIYTPTKLTATQLKGREKDQEIAENTLQPYTRSSFAAPRFLSGQRPLTADQRGTAMHLVLQYLPLDGSGQKTVDELLARRLLTPEQAAAVDVAAIDRFLASPLAEELRQAKELEREFRFSLLVPAGMYYPELGEEDEVLLQGVVDLYAVSDGKVTVVDFKTDRVTERTLPERVARYRPQLEAYSGALEKILDKTVARRVLYFFHTGNTVEV